MVSKHNISKNRYKNAVKRKARSMDFEYIQLKEIIENLKEENKILRKRNKELINEVCSLKYTKRKYVKRQQADIIKDKEYALFRLNILKRDNYTCKECGSKERLQVHHIKSRKDYPELIMDENNCITLCITCHSKTDNFFTS